MRTDELGVSGKTCTTGATHQNREQADGGGKQRERMKLHIHPHLRRLLRAHENATVKRRPLILK